MTWHISGNNDLNFNQTLLFADLSIVTQYVGKITGQRSLLQRKWKAKCNENANASLYQVSSWTEVSIDLESVFVLMKESRILDQYCFLSDSPAELTSFCWVWLVCAGLRLVLQVDLDIYVKIRSEAYYRHKQKHRCECLDKLHCIYYMFNKQSCITVAVTNSISQGHNRVSCVYYSGSSL